MRIKKIAFLSCTVICIGMVPLGPAIGADADKEAPKPAQDQTASGSPSDQSSSAPIRGFHPIKRALQPVQNLEGLGIKLEQQIMKLEKPIVALQPPMTSLQGQMNVINDSMAKMEKRVTVVKGQMTGVRSDLAQMQDDIAQSRKPILSIQKPLASIADPLEGVKRQLNMVMLAIFGMAIGIVFGTPLAAIVTYRYRHKLFPPKVAAQLPDDRKLATTSAK